MFVGSGVLLAGKAILPIRAAGCRLSANRIISIPKALLGTVPLGAFLTTTTHPWPQEMVLR
jgi:hypothetical protein